MSLSVSTRLILARPLLSETCARFGETTRSRSLGRANAVQSGLIRRCREARFLDARRFRQFRVQRLASTATVLDLIPSFPSVRRDCVPIPGRDFSSATLFSHPAPRRHKRGAARVRYISQRYSISWPRSCSRSLFVDVNSSQPLDQVK